MRRLCWLGLGAGGSVGAGAGGGGPGGSAGGGAQSGMAAVSVDGPLLMLHYVDVTINGDSYFVNCYYSLLLNSGKRPRLNTNKHE